MPGSYSQVYGYWHIYQMFAISRIQVNGSWSSTLSGSGTNFYDMTSLALLTNRETAGRTITWTNTRLYVTFGWIPYLSGGVIGTHRNMTLTDANWVMWRTATATVADNDAHSIKPYKGTWSLMQSPGSSMYNDYSNTVYADTVQTNAWGTGIMSIGWDLNPAHGGFLDYMQDTIITPSIKLQICFRTKSDGANRAPSGVNRSDWAADNHTTSGYRPYAKVYYGLPTPIIHGSTF